MKGCIIRRIVSAAAMIFTGVILTALGCEKMESCAEEFMKQKEDQETVCEEQI